MSEEEIKTDNQNNNNPKPWLWKKGQSGNLLGRPKGKSLKEWSRERLAAMTEEERDEFLNGLSKIDIWKQAEGNPTNEIIGGLDIKVSKLETIQSDTKNILNGQDKETSEKQV